MPWQRLRLKRFIGFLTLTWLGFGAIAIGHHNGISQAVIASVKKQYGAAAEKRLINWQDTIHQHLDDPVENKLRVVNDFFNQNRFIDDIKLWKTTDYWATPVEFLARNAGDCEDFSIAKYFTLKEMGVDTKKLRITYVKALRLNQAHMVLAYYPTPSSIPLILDNLTPQIKPANERTDLQPVYSFNADELWLSRTRNEQVKAGKPSQLGRWMELNKRITRETSTSGKKNIEKRQDPQSSTDNPKNVKPEKPPVSISPQAQIKTDYFLGISLLKMSSPKNTACNNKPDPLFFSLTNHSYPLVCKAKNKDRLFSKILINGQ